MQKRGIEELIINACTGNISKTEQKVLDKWISESLENKKEFDAYAVLWEKSEKLIISQNIDVESSLKETKKKIPISNTKKSLNFYIGKIAAFLIVAIALNITYLYFKEKNTETDQVQTVYQEIKAAFGTQTKISLADGTNVWLNSGSLIRFPSNFSNEKERRVELDGEGYFEVSKNGTKPFIVQTTALDIKVYGTSFNVLSYSDYNTMSVALVEGKVSLIKNFEKGQKELLVMSPNDVVTYDLVQNKLYQSKELFMDKYTAWKDGQIVFYGDPIDMVVKRLEKWYNVKMVIGDRELENYRFTATFIDESLEQVLKLLSLSSPIEYTITPAQKQKDNSFTMRKVILTKKK